MAKRKSRLTQKQKQSQSVVVNITSPRTKSRAPPSLQKAGSGARTTLVPSSDRFIPSGYSQPSLVDILTALKSAKEPPSLQKASRPEGVSASSGVSAFLGGTGRLMENAILPESFGTTPPPSTFLGTDNLLNLFPEPPKRTLLPTETEIPLPTQTIFDLATRESVSPLVPTLGPLIAGLVPRANEESPETEVGSVPLQLEGESLEVSEPVQGIVEEGPSTELPLTEPLPQLITPESLSTGMAAEAPPLSSLQLVEGSGEDIGTPVRTSKKKRQIKKESLL